MKMDSAIDCLGYILFRVLGYSFRFLPPEFCLYLGRRAGGALYYLDPKHRRIAHSNIKRAFGSKLYPAQIKKLTRDFYRNLGESFFEIFLIPSVDKKYIEKYIKIEGLQHVVEALKKGRGVIVLGVHAGSWELSNIVAANLGFPFSIFVRNQRLPRLNKLLNHYRQKKGCRIIQRENLTRGVIEALINNEVVGMTADQGGRRGVPVKFFGKTASMASGAVRLALKYDSIIVPGFLTRTKGPYIRAFLEAPFTLKKSGDLQKDIKDNLQALTRIFEKYIEEYGKDYFWSYKIWKYSDQKNILILSDQKAGHLRQSEAVAKLIISRLKEKGVTTHIDSVEIAFRSGLSKKAFVFSSIFSGKYQCQGCLWCLKRFLKNEPYESLMHRRPDIIISCGSGLAPVNFLLSRENSAKSVVVLRPGILSTKRFDLVIMPKHDSPPKRKNVVVTDGALNLIDVQYLQEESKKLFSAYSLQLTAYSSYIGLLIGGDTKDFHLDKDALLEVIRQTKNISEKLNCGILVTTSRRTSREVEELVKAEFKGYPYCKLLVIANEKNIPEAMGGILGLSNILVSSPESISMISEAVNSKKYVFVFKSCGLDKRHCRFLENFAKNRSIYLVGPEELSRRIEEVWSSKPPVNLTKDNLMVSEAIQRIL